MRIYLPEKVIFMHIHVNSLNAECKSKSTFLHLAYSKMNKQNKTVVKIY